MLIAAGATVRIANRAGATYDPRKINGDVAIVAALIAAGARNHLDFVVGGRVSA